MFGESSEGLSPVNLYLQGQSDNFLRVVFNKFAVCSSGTTFHDGIADDSSEFGLIRVDGLQTALGELGVHLEREKVNKLLKANDLDEKDGLDFEGFKRAVRTQPPTQLEQWASMLPLAGILAKSLPVSDGQEDQPLRDFIRLSNDEIEKAVKVFSVGLKRILIEARDTMSLTFKIIDQKASDAVADSARGVSVVSKYKSFKMSTGKVDDYFQGLFNRIGAPNPNFAKGIKDEHCVKWGFDVEFTTCNYGLTTTPRKEYEISTSKQDCPEEDMKDKKGRRVRIIRRIEELKLLKVCQKARLTDDEILAVVLYSGPMFQVYNTVLRRSPSEKFEQFQQGRNLFATTIFVLESAILKISRVMLLPTGLELFRGLGGLVELPDSFYESDENGCSGYLEYGFLSTTSHRETAIEYSGSGEGKPLPMVLQTRASSIDRGACIKELSQYPGEVEYLWPAFSYIESSGPSYTVSGGGNLLTMVPVRINANVKALTVEELLTQKKDMHINAFCYQLAETARELEQIAETKSACDRLQRDDSRKTGVQDWLSAGGKLEWLLPGMSDGKQVTFTVEGLHARIMQQSEAVCERHKNMPPELYNNNESFRHTVVEMLETKAAAVSTLLNYIEDPHALIEAMMRATLTGCHRGYLSFLERTLPTEGEERVSKAGQLCRFMGVMRSSPNEEDEEGLTLLMRAAADGAGLRILRCLVAAKADVNRREATHSRTALFLAARGGHAEVVEALARLGGDVESTAYLHEITPMIIASEKGHTAVIKVLHQIGADVNRADKNKRTPVFTAAEYGLTTAIVELGRLKADVNLADKDGMTPLHIAIKGGQTAAADALRRLEAVTGATNGT